MNLLGFFYYDSGYTQYMGSVQMGELRLSLLGAKICRSIYGNFTRPAVIGCWAPILRAR